LESAYNSASLYTNIPHCEKICFTSILCLTQQIMTSALEASGQNKYFLVFSTLLDALAPILTIFLLKMQKSQKSAHPTVQYIWRKYKSSITTSCLYCTVHYRYIFYSQFFSKEKIMRQICLRSQIRIAVMLLSDFSVKFQLLLSFKKNVLRIPGKLFSTIKS
jgi:hypothetical protein